MSVVSLSTLEDILLIYVGLVTILGALILWHKAKTQPENVPVYNRAGRLMSRKDMYTGAALFLILGIFFVIVGLVL